MYHYGGVNTPSYPARATIPHLQIPPLVQKVPKIVMSHADRLLDEVGLGSRELLLQAFLTRIASPIHTLDPLAAFRKDIERHDDNGIQNQLVQE